MEKLFFLTNRVIPDIETEIPHFTMRVSKSDEDYWNKLRRVLVQIKNNIDDETIIGASILKDVYTWIYTTYEVNPNMRSHTGGAMYFGTGIVHIKLSKT